MCIDAQIPDGVVVDDAAGVEALDDRLGAQGELGVVLRPRVARGRAMPSIMSGFMSSS